MGRYTPRSSPVSFPSVGRGIYGYCLWGRRDGFQGCWRYKMVASSSRAGRRGRVDRDEEGLEGGGRRREEGKGEEEGEKERS